MDAYASVGMPVELSATGRYGKEFIRNEKTYRRGHMGLAYEIVINSDPVHRLPDGREHDGDAGAGDRACRATATTASSRATTCSGMWTDAVVDHRLPGLRAEATSCECEERHGVDAVEDLLDSCHALMNHGVDRYRRPQPLSLKPRNGAPRASARRYRAAAGQRPVAHAAAQAREQADDEAARSAFPHEPQENLLYFIEKNAPLLEPWQREIVRIVRKIAQYFYPQRQTQVMNEGWATFWHYTLLNTLYDEASSTDGFMIEWLKSHTNVVFQPPVRHRAYSGINPYALGFAMFTDMRAHLREARPTKTARWFPDIAGSDWLTTLDHAMRNFKDESFIGQYLSPELMREFRLFAIADDETESDARGRRHPRRRAATAACAKRWRTSTTSAARAQHPGRGASTARRPLADAAPHRSAAAGRSTTPRRSGRPPAPAVGLPGAAGNLGRRRRVDSVDAIAA